MTFRITGLSADPFRPLFGLPDVLLLRRGARRVVADAPDAYPCRVSLRDAAPGETLLLLNHEHQPADTPFRSRHAIFVNECAEEAFDAVGTVPDQLRRRPLSLRAFDAGHMMIDADLCEGAAVEPLIARLLAEPATAYVQAHFARRGCYAARIARA